MCRNSSYLTTPYINECLIYNIRIIYDGCSSSSLEDSKKFYGECGPTGWIHVGSGHKTWHNGEKYINKKLYHFFVYPHRIKDIRKLKLGKIKENI